MNKLEGTIIVCLEVSSPALLAEPSTKEVCARCAGDLWVAESTRKAQDLGLLERPYRYLCIHCTAEEVGER